MPRPDDVLEITVAEMRAAIRKARRAAYRKGEATATSFLKAVAKLNGSAAPLLKGLSDPPPAPTSDDATDPHAALYEALLGAVIDARESGDNDAVAGLVEAYRDHLDDPETLAAALSEPSGRGDGSLSKSSAAAVARVLLKAHEWRLLKAGKYDENKHPRDDHGRFVSRDAIADAKGDPAKEEALRDKVTDPEQREKLDNALAGTTDLGRTKAGQRKHEAGQRREKRAASHARAAELADKIAAGEATPEDMHELGDHLEGLTVDKLRALQSRIPTAGRTRRKAEMVAALRDSLEKSAHLKRVTDGAAGVEGRRLAGDIDMGTGMRGRGTAAAGSLFDTAGYEPEDTRDGHARAADDIAVAAIRAGVPGLMVADYNAPLADRIDALGAIDDHVSELTGGDYSVTPYGDMIAEAAAEVADNPDVSPAEVVAEYIDHDKKFRRQEMEAAVQALRDAGHERLAASLPRLVDRAYEVVRAAALGETPAPAAAGAAKQAPAESMDHPRLALAGLLPNRYDVTTADGEVVKAGTGYQRFEGQGKAVGYTAAQAAKVAAGVTPDHADRRIQEHERAASAPDLDDVQREYHATIADQLRGHKETVFGGEKPAAALESLTPAATQPANFASSPAPVAGLTDDELRAEQAALPRRTRTLAQGERDREIARELARRNPLPAGGGTPVMMGGGKGPGHNGEDSAGAAMLGSPKPADPASAHAATLPEGSPARAAIEAALANGGGDKRRTLKELGHRHAEMASQMSPEEERGYVEMMAAHGVKPLHEPGQTVPFDPETMQSDAGISTGTPVKVTRRGWTGLYGDANVGHENIGNNYQRAQVEPAASATVGTPPEAKPVAATPKAAKPKAAMPLHANGLPDVKAGASAKPDDPAYQAAGRALLADDGFRKDLADAYNHQRLFVEHRDGLIPLDRVYHELAKRRPGVTVDQLHAAVDHLSRERGVEMHALNEIAKVPADERIATISRNDRNYHFMRFPGGADAEKMKPAKAAKPPAPAKPTPARQPKVAPASGYGQSGADHPLGQTDADHYRSLGDAIAAHGGYGGKFPAGGTEDDPLGHGAAGFPAGVDRAAFVTDVRGVVGRSQVARAVGASFPELYATVGKKYGMSKHDFARAMHDVDESREPGLRASGWSRMLTDMPEPGLATMNRGKVMHYIQPTGAGTADLEAMAGEGDTSLNVDHPEVRKRFGGGAPSPEPTAAPAAAADPTAELAKLERIPFGKHTKEQRKRLAELRAAPAP